MWHDEYKCPDTGAYVHGILLLPINRKTEIISILENLRKGFGYQKKEKHGFASSLRVDKPAQFLRNHLSIGTHLLSVKSIPDTKLCYANGKMRYTKDYDNFMSIPGHNPFCLKLGLLVVPNNHVDMLCSDYSTKIETTLRFGLKGLCHWAFNKDNPINIQKFYFDGNEHHKREFDIDRIIGKKEWRDYIKIDSDKITIDDRHRKERGGQTALMMDFLDAMIGGLYNKTYTSREDKYHALYPLEEIVDRLMSGKTNKQVNSKWYKAITMSEVYLTDNEEQPFDFRPFQFKQEISQYSFGI